MYDFNEGFPLGGLLEQVNGAAVACDGGLVCEFNNAALRLIPQLTEGTPLNDCGSGDIELCSVRFAAARFSVGELEVYTFAGRSDESVSGASAFLGNLGTSMINTLGTSFAAAELIAENIDNRNWDNVSKYNAILRHTQYKLLHIAENLRELGELGVSPENITPSTFDLDELCADVVSTAHSLIRKKGINMEFHSNCDNTYIYADRARVERMLLDILANSIASCSRGCTIRVSLSQLGGSLQISVSDNGRGIPPDILSRVFSSGTIQLEPGDEPRGLGLSLCVARNIALRHGGNLLINPISGGGTSVVISLPQTQSRVAFLRSSSVEYNARSMRPVLSAFADILDYEYYATPFI